MEVKVECGHLEVKDECEESDPLVVKDECATMRVREECDPSLCTTEHDALTVYEDSNVQEFNDDLLQIEDNLLLIKGKLKGMMKPQQIT